MKFVIVTDGRNISAFDHSGRNTQSMKSDEWVEIFDWIRFRADLHIEREHTIYAETEES